MQIRARSKIARNDIRKKQLIIYVVKDRNDVFLKLLKIGAVLNAAISFLLP